MKLQLDRTKSQTQLIAIHLRTGRSIDPMLALREFGCFRLSARIFNIKQEYGIKIKRSMVTEGDKTFARYRIDKSK